MRWATVASVLLTVLAMCVYPGGTLRDPSTRGYSLFENSLSDLGSTVAFNGQANSLGAWCFLSAFAILAIAGVACFVVFIRVYSASSAAHKIARAAGAAGLLSSAALLGAALIPEDRHPTLHGKSALVASVAITAATMLFALATARDRRFRRRVPVGWLTLATMFVGWLFVIFLPTGSPHPVIGVVFQKILAITLLVVFWFQSHEAERVLVT